MAIEGCCDSTPGWPAYGCALKEYSPVPSSAVSITPAFRSVMLSAAPVTKGWGRLRVTGLEHIPLTGPLLIAGNHDSWWDPIVIGQAAMSRRQIRALAKQELWSNRVVGRVLDGMGQIPVDRGRTGAHALVSAISELRAGACIGVFPEGTRSRGRDIRARSGIGWIASAVPNAQVVCATVEGTTDVVRFPCRPRIHVRFFVPEGGSLQENEKAIDFSARLLNEIRSYAPAVPCGRRKSTD